MAYTDKEIVSHLFIFESYTHGESLGTLPLHILLLIFKSVFSLAYQIVHVP